MTFISRLTKAMEMQNLEIFHTPDVSGRRLAGIETVGGVSKSADRAHIPCIVRIVLCGRPIGISIALENRATNLLKRFIHFIETLLTYLDDVLQSLKVSEVLPNPPMEHMYHAP